MRSRGRRPATLFKREFKAFLAATGFRLKHFLPDDYFGEKMFPDCLIPRATGFEKLRGQGGLTEELTLLWVRRSECFLAEGLKKATERGEKLPLDGISFVDQVDGQPKINWKKLILLYEVERMIPRRIKIDNSSDDAEVAAITARVRAALGDVRIPVARVREGWTEITILVPRLKVDEIVTLVTGTAAPGDGVDAGGATLPPRGTMKRS